MSAWVKFADGVITEGPIASPDQPEGFVEYVEVIDLPPGHGPATVTVAMVDGKCVKTVTSTPDYSVQRAAEYPLMADYIDGVVKGDQAQIDKYIADCLAIKAKYPKPSA
jgi:hypothetical protein